MCGAEMGGEGWICGAEMGACVGLGWGRWMGKGGDVGGWESACGAEMGRGWMCGAGGGCVGLGSEFCHVDVRWGRAQMCGAGMWGEDVDVWGRAVGLGSVHVGQSCGAQHTHVGQSCGAGQCLCGAELWGSAGPCGAELWGSAGPCGAGPWGGGAARVQGCWAAPRGGQGPLWGRAEATSSPPISPPLDPQEPKLGGRDFIGGLGLCSPGVGQGGGVHAAAGAALWGRKMGLGGDLGGGRHTHTHLGGWGICGGSWGAGGHLWGWGHT